MLRKHTLRITGPNADGKYTGKCSCGDWVGINQNPRTIADKHLINHVNRIKKK